MSPKKLLGNSKYKHYKVASFFLEWFYFKEDENNSRLY